MAHMSIPCHEGPPATAGHLCSEPAVAGGGRYYCMCVVCGGCRRERAVCTEYVLVTVGACVRKCV